MGQPERVEVIDRDHPDYDHYRELEEVEHLIAAGEAYVEGNRRLRLLLTRCLCATCWPWTRAQAGALLGGKSVDWIERYVLPEVETIKPSRSVLIPRTELERWMRENTGKALP